MCGRAYCTKYTDYIYVNEIGELVKQGYQLCTIDELFELKGIKLHSGTVFRSAKQSSDS